MTLTLLRIYNRLVQHFQKHTTPSMSEAKDVISYWREKILLYFLYILIVLAVISYLPSIILAVSQDLWSIVVVDTTAYVFLAYLFYSKTLSVRFRIISILVLSYSMGLFLTVTVGQYGAGYLWLFVLPIMAAVLTGLRTTLLTILINLATILAVGFLNYYGIIPKSYFTIFSFSSWLVITANFIFLDLIVSLAVLLITTGLKKALLKEKGVSSSIEEKSYELVKAKENAEKADSLKTHFLTQISHEIRTPLNTIVSSISLIKETLSEIEYDERKEIFAMIYSGSNRIIRTIDLILNMSEVQAGSYEPSIERLKLIEDVLKPVIYDLQHLAIQKDLKLELVNYASEDTTIYADSYATSQIFVNLIDNALKYTREGYISINISEDAGSVNVDVIDTGIGISEDYLNELFVPFTQEERGYTRRFDGNGLGLALVKKYCELNNAQISVESGKGKGSKFSVRFAKMFEEIKTVNVFQAIN